MPFLSGMREPRLTRFLPVERALAPPDWALCSALMVARLATPVAGSWAARWNFLTARTVPGPYCPSTLTRMPAARSAFCSERTSDPLAPARRELLSAIATGAETTP